MAELELTVAYRARPARVGLFVMMGLMPIWAIAAPFCLGMFLALLLQHSVAFVTAVAVLCILVGVPFVSIMLAAYCEDDRIMISREGIGFPLLLMRSLGLKRERIWGDLADAQLISAEKRAQLLLGFKSGGVARLNLANISQSDLEQFMLALEVWGKNCRRAPELIEYQNRLQNENRGLDQISYTQMWEEELGRRFSATSFMPLEPDHSLQNGRFKVVRQLAFGGLSAIYLAQQNEKDLVVIKEAVVPASADTQSKEKAAELFEREARLLIRLNHPNIARVYDHFAEQGRNYLVLEYIRGQDLRQFVKQNGAQPEELVLHWAWQIASILDHLHKQSPPIIHRDLTPDNLVRTDDEKIVLIDFGAANEFVGTATGTLVGKQAYIAPEQLRGKATLSSDIYALGGTIFFLLTGTDPEALSQSHPLELKPISQDLDALVAACTELEVEDRTSDTEALGRKLKKMIDETPTKTAAAPGSRESSS
ncbi:MAG TPA: serine/threonine-protein kinase [Trichormus sp.]